MSDITAYEVDFLPVGSGDRSGDAIAVRWQDGDKYKVLVYDGGNQESGQALVDHIKKHYGTSHVDYLVNSHPDADHASGLSIVVEQLTIGEIWLHRPWAYSSVILDYFHDGRITDESLAERLKDKMGAAYALEELAEEKCIPIYEPFQGSKIGPFTVLSPDSDWYVHTLIAAFEKSPAQKKAEAARGLIASAMLSKASAALRAAIEWVAEHWGAESLREDVETSAENLSSVVMLAIMDGRGVLLTGDAGVDTLHRAADYAHGTLLHDLPSLLNFVQVPHHGSRNNVSTSALDRILGPRKDANDGLYSKTAFVSAGKESETHPRQMVVNAFLRRGVNVFKTKGASVRHSRNMPDRSGWGAAAALQFSTQVEKWD